MFFSRQRWQEKFKAIENEIDEKDRELKAISAELEKRDKLIASQACQIRELQETLTSAKADQTNVRLPDDPPLYQHQYGKRMISLSVNLAARIGLRAAERVLRIVFDWLGVQCDIPTWQSIRGWMQRVGLARMTKQPKEGEELHWLVDHSVQVGQEKVLAVVGVATSRLPARGQALKHEDLSLLTILPGTSWKAEDVGEAYRSLEKQFGTPRSISSDGATELHEGAKSLENGGVETVLVRDFKHYLANQFEALIGNTPRFSEFIKQVTSTRSAVQQTELSHFGPRSLKQKARFMNMGDLLNWANMVGWQLAHPESKARQDIADERMEAKLGWLREFDAEIQVWWECQQIISSGVTFISENGIFRGAAKAFKKLNKDHTQHQTSRTLIQRCCTFLEKSEGPLKKNERLPMSTEIVESCFGLYKQLEGQHSKGGFTQLIVAFGALLQPTTPESIRDDFARVKVQDVKEWCAKNLSTTLTSKRQAAYHEYRNTQQIKPRKRATATPAWT
jgi:hypothetical protein